MKAFALGAAGLLALSCAACADNAPVRTAAASSPACARDGDLALICGARRPEDLVPVPGSDWVIGSWLGEGIVAIHAREKTPRLIFPSPAAKLALDTATYPDCPGAAAALTRFQALGLSLQPLGGGRFKLYSTAMNDQAGVYIFDLDVTGRQPTLALTGCVPAPGDAFINSVTPLPEGGFATTRFATRPDTPEQRAKRERGETSGEVLEWHPGKGWAKVPGSDMSAANGIVVSPDGKHLFVNSWGEKKLVRLERGTNPPRRDELPTGYHMDNLRWDGQGRLLATAHDPTRWMVFRIDPQTLTAEKLVERADTELFQHGTVAIQVGNEIWVGSSRSNHIAVVPARP